MTGHSDIHKVRTCVVRYDKCFKSFHAPVACSFKSSVSRQHDNSLIADPSHCLHCFLTSRVSCVSSGGAAGPRLNNDQLYKFSYSTEVLVDRVRGSKEGTATGYRISSDVDVNLVWRDPSNKDDQLIQLAVCWSNQMIRQRRISF